MSTMEVTITRKGRDVGIDSAAFNAKVGRYMKSSTQRKIRQGVAPANAPLTVAVKQNNLTLRDSGELMTTISCRSDAQKAVVGTNRIGARLQQFGGTVRARNGKYLWIPASAKIRTLQSRYSFRATGVLEGLRRDGYVYWFSKDHGTGRCVRARKGKGRPFTVFILKKSVRIPARPFLYVDDLDRKTIDLMMSRMIKEAKDG